MQGCPIGIPKNPEISGSSRNRSFGTAEEVGVVAELSTKKSVDSSKNRGGGVVADPSKNKSVDSAIN